jgi:trimeric autotransporter adhesin
VRCDVSIASDAGTLPAGGGTATIAVKTEPECDWTAATQAPWITRLTPGRGQGPASIVAEAGSNAGPPRSAIVTVADQSLTVQQASGCAYGVEPLSLVASSQGSEAVLTIATHEGCVWSAVSQVPWIAVVAGATGAGSGVVTLAIESNATPPRQGTVSVAGQTVTIDQVSGCTYAVAPATVSLPAAASDASVSLAAGAGCAWGAVSLSPWVTLLSSPSGVGSATVSFRAAANIGPARTGSLVVEGQVVTVQQAEGCTYALSTTSLTFGFLGGTGIVSISTAPGCAWTATSGNEWIQVNAPGQGVGSGSVTIGVAPSFATRTGTVTIAGQQLMVRQN